MGAGEPGPDVVLGAGELDPLAQAQLADAPRIAASSAPRPSRHAAAPRESAAPPWRMPRSASRGPSRRGSWRCRRSSGVPGVAQLQRRTRPAVADAGDALRRVAVASRAGTRAPLPSRRRRGRSACRRGGRAPPPAGGRRPGSALPCWWLRTRRPPLRRGRAAARTRACDEVDLGHVGGQLAEARGRAQRIVAGRATGRAPAPGTPRSRTRRSARPAPPRRSGRRG